jgi:hypothetical protein
MRGKISKYIKVPADTLAVESHFAEGQFIIEEPTWSIVKSVRYRVWGL